MECGRDYRGVSGGGKIGTPLLRIDSGNRRRKTSDKA